MRREFLERRRKKLLIDILPDAEVYLLDEPMIGLDKGAISRIRGRIGQMIKEGKTILITVPEVKGF